MIELRISPGGRRFLAWIPDQAMQGDTQETGIVLAEWKIFQRNGRKTFQQLQNEKNRLYTGLGRGDDS